MSITILFLVNGPGISRLSSLKTNLGKVFIQQIPFEYTQSFSDRINGLLSNYISIWFLGKEQFYTFKLYQLSREISILKNH